MRTFVNVEKRYLYFLLMKIINYHKLSSLNRKLSSTLLMVIILRKWDTQKFISGNQNSYNFIT